MKIPERWKRPFRLALIIMALVILTIANKYYVQFSLNFSFGSQPVKTETPAPEALRTQVTIEYPVIRYRNQSTFNMDVSVT